jgi:hypothetical protein
MMPDDLMTAYQTFTLLALKHGYAYAGFMMSANPPELIGIGNVTESGRELAILLRRYADILDQKADQGLVVSDRPQTESIN